MASRWKESKKTRRRPAPTHGDAYEGPTNGKHKTEPVPCVGRVLSRVQRKETDWLWKGYLPLGKLTILDGDPDAGKSFLTCAIAALVTRGEPFIDGWATPEAGVVMVNAEDTAEDTLVARLANHGANLERILHIEGVPTKNGVQRGMSFPQDIDLLESAIKSMEASFVCIDPIMNHLGGGTKTRDDIEVRAALNPLKHLAERLNVCILMVRHLNKGEMVNTLYRGAGSMGFIALARVGLIVGTDPDNETARVLAVNKCNIAKKAPSIRYQIFSKPDETGFVSFIGTSSHGARAVLAGLETQDDGKSMLEDAKEVLKEILKKGALPVAEVEAEAGKARISGITLRRAKELLGVKSIKQGVGEKGFWKWALPPEAAETGPKSG